MAFIVYVKNVEIKKLYKRKDDFKCQYLQMKCLLARNAANA